MKEIYLAPLEGIGNHIYRNAFARHYEGVDRFYTPFLDIGADGSMKNRCKKDILPENNKGLRIIPQVLTKYPDALTGCAKRLEQLGYDEININMGCPYSTVMSKGKGAAMLADTDRLRAFLDEAFNNCPISISIKARIGISNTDEMPKILEVFNDYPIRELSIHPRLQRELYDGDIHEDILEYICRNSKNPVCINPGVKTVAEYSYYLDKYPETTGVMIGRGLISNPQLAENIKVQDPAAELDLSRFFEFHNNLLDSYRKELSGDVPVLFKMKELWNYWRKTISVDDKTLKAIKKAGSINEYRNIIRAIF